MRKKKRGVFITLEGPDGSGKSTQFKVLAKRLRREGYKILTTREPGGHPLAEKIRQLLLKTSDNPPSAETELLLFLAARTQHVGDVIQPALDKKHIVLCERFSDSTYAYQVGGRKLSPIFVQAGNYFATKGLKPDLTLLYDLPLAEGLRRAYQAKHHHDRMESEPITFLRNVQKCYRQLARQEPNRIKVIPANRPQEEVSQKTWEIVRRKLRRTEKGSHAI